jgi:hypothetical protein
MIPFCLGVPITAGKTDLGESSPAIPVLQRPEPVKIRELDQKQLDCLVCIKRGKQLYQLSRDCFIPLSITTADLVAMLKKSLEAARKRKDFQLSYRKVLNQCVW